MIKLLALLQAAIVFGTVILYGSMGEILTEKSGNLNLGVPGIMYLGGIAGLAGAFTYQNSAANPTGSAAFLIALACALGASVLGGLIYCFLTVTLRANQNVTGLTLTIFGTGLANLYGGAMNKMAGGVGQISVATASDAFRATIAPFRGLPLLNGLGCLVYIAIVIAIIMSWFLSRTRKGLNLRAVGESPATADAAGINVTKYKYLATCIGSMIAGLGGLYYVMDYACGVWSNDAFGDRGWLAIALVIFTVWKPNIGVLASFLFGGLYILHIFLPSGTNLAVKELYKMIPYVVTIIVLIITSVRSKRENQPPASLGLPYFREER